MNMIVGQTKKTQREIRASFSGVRTDAAYAIVADVWASGNGEIRCKLP